MPAAVAVMQKCWTTGAVTKTQGCVAMGL